MNLFYPSLYTHAIPWAIHGKATAKARRGRTKADRIDVRSRQLHHGETIGVPIGPDTSLVLAEVVLGAVDHALLSAVGPVTGFRFVDDYELAFQTLARAEQALAGLERALADYRLALNVTKSSIEELPQPITSQWAYEISRFPVSASPRGALRDTMALFSRAFELAASSPDDAVLRYTLMRARTLPANAHGWKTLQGLILGAAAAEPTAMPVALDLLALHQQRGLKLSLVGVSELVEALILRSSGRASGSEVAWSLWAAIAFNVQLSNEAALHVSRMDDDVVALLALDAEARGLFGPGALDHTLWASLVTAPLAATDEHWLLSYEATLKNWLPPSPSVVSDPFFARLLGEPVAFYVRHPLRLGFTGAAAPVPGGLLPTGYV